MTDRDPRDTQIREALHAAYRQSEAETVVELIDTVLVPVVRGLVEQVQKSDGIRYDAGSKTWVARHTILTAARTKREAELALASAFKLLSAHWPLPAPPEP